LVNWIRFHSVFLLGSLCLAQYPEWRPIGPWGGAARQVGLDAARPDTMLALGLRGASVYRSRDGGRRWTHLKNFPDLEGARLDAALMAPGQWLVGAAPGGIWRSSDEGESWQRIASTARLSVFALTAWAGDPRVIAAGTSEGVWMTHDGGASWRRISPKSIADLSAIVSVAFDPRRAGTLFAGTPHLPWKTVNGGETWQKIATGMYDDSDIFSLAVDPREPSRVFASACSGIYASLNGGTAWRRVQGIPGTNRRTYVVSQSPHDRRTLFAGTSAGMWSSGDSGLSWTKRNDFVATSIAWHPADPRRFYISTERHGLLETTDGGDSFAPRNEGFASRALSALASTAAEFFALAPYEGLFRWSGGAWQPADCCRHYAGLRIDGGQARVIEPDAPAPAREPGFETATDPFAPQVRLRASLEGLAKSTDGGRSWRLVQQEWIRSVTFHPKRKGLCFALRHRRVFWSPDAGENWYWLPAQEDSHLVFEKIYVSEAMPDLLVAQTPSRGLYVQSIGNLR
jgi:photosystem II stability/assembly factor-like uncharacterized protein